LFVLNGLRRILFVSQNRLEMGKNSGRCVQENAGKQILSAIRKGRHQMLCDRVQASRERWSSRLRLPSANVTAALHAATSQNLGEINAKSDVNIVVNKNQAENRITHTSLAPNPFGTERPFPWRLTTSCNACSPTGGGYLLVSLPCFQLVTGHRLDLSSDDRIAPLRLGKAEWPRSKGKCPVVGTRGSVVRDTILYLKNIKNGR
jgi:hypothetical protein